MTTEEIHGVGKNIAQQIPFSFQELYNKDKKQKKRKQTKKTNCLYPEPVALNKVNEEVSLKLVKNFFE